MKFAFVLVLIALDTITGNVQALKNKTWISSKMREGLFHKMAIIIFIILAILCDYGQQFLELGFTLPITDGVLVYISIMEIGSNAENLIKINPELKTIVTKLFKKETDKLL